MLWYFWPTIVSSPITLVIIAFYSMLQFSMEVLGSNPGRTNIQTESESAVFVITSANGWTF